MTCTCCGKGLTFNELGLCKKYAPQDRRCLPCLARKLGVAEGRLREKIEEFVRAGCVMFVPESGQRPAEAV